MSYHPLFQVSNVAIQVCPALQLPKANKDENFVDGQLTAKSSRITSLKNVYVYGTWLSHITKHFFVLSTPNCSPN